MGMGCLTSAMTLVCAVHKTDEGGTGTGESAQVLTRKN